MELAKLLSKTFTAADLFKYTNDLLTESYNMDSAGTPRADVEAVDHKREIAIEFIANYLFNGNCEAVEDVITAEHVLERGAGRENDLEHIYNEEYVPFDNAEPDGPLWE